jgi:hypothetical protein
MEKKTKTKNYAICHPNYGGECKMQDSITAMVAQVVEYLCEALSAKVQHPPNKTNYNNK